MFTIYCKGCQKQANSNRIIKNPYASSQSLEKM